jgi:hypothetical protein
MQDVRWTTISLGIRCAYSRSRRQKNKQQILPMKTPSKIVLAAITIGLFFSSAVLIPQARATPITGSIDFGVGTVTYNTTSLATATQVSTWTGAQVTLANGSFASIPLFTPATLAMPWIFNPSTPTSGLWTVTSGPNTFSFDLASSTIVSQSATFLNITGPGTIHGTGFMDTPGVWSFTSTNASGQNKTDFTFTTDTSASAPDGGATVALLGLALTGLEGLRRLLRRS